MRKKWKTLFVEGLAREILRRSSLIEVGEKLEKRFLWRKEKAAPPEQTAQRAPEKDGHR